MRKITINVDDLGLSEAVNQAVVNLAEKQRIHSSSYMVGGNISEAHLKTLDKCGIDIGLHLDFTEIFPSPLTRSLKSVLISAYARQLDVAQVTDNITKQFDLFEETFGRVPAFVDGHQHVHQFPIIREALVKEIKNRSTNSIASLITSPIASRITSPIASRTTTPLCKDLKSWLIFGLGGNAWKLLCENHDIATNERFAGVYDFNTNEAQLKKLWEKWLSASVENTLIMCHPAIPCKNWQDKIKSAREIEYHWLMSDTFEYMFAKHI